MLVHTMHDRDASRCTLTYDVGNGWLRATWRGFVDPCEAVRGAAQYLAFAPGFRCSCLLNDTQAVRALV